MTINWFEGFVPPEAPGRAALSYLQCLYIWSDDMAGSVTGTSRWDWHYVLSLWISANMSGYSIRKNGIVMLVDRITRWLLEFDGRRSLLIWSIAFDQWQWNPPLCSHTRTFYERWLVFTCKWKTWIVSLSMHLIISLPRWLIKQRVKRMWRLFFQRDGWWLIGALVPKGTTARASFSVRSFSQPPNVKNQKIGRSGEGLNKES